MGGRGWGEIIERCPIFPKHMYVCVVNTYINTYIMIYDYLYTCFDLYHPSVQTKIWNVMDIPSVWILLCTFWLEKTYSEEKTMK